MVNRTLWVGFGGVLLLIAMCGVATRVGFTRLQNDEASIRAATLERAADLQRVREAVLLSGTLARDYLFWADGETAGAVKERFAQLERESLAALGRWKGPQAEALRGEVNTYWKSLDVLMEVAGRERRHAVDRYFHADLAKRLEATLALADRVSALEKAEREREQQQVAAFADGFARTLTAGFAAALVLGGVIAVAAIRSLRRLEADAVARRRELEALSSRLLKTQEEERKSVARELHDQVGQMLTALSMECGHALHAAEARSHLDSIARTTEGLIVAVRDISLALRPSMLDDFGLLPALEWHAREVKRRSGIDVVVAGTEEDCEGLSEAARTCIYRVAQEALRNCERHAQASRVELRLEREGGGVRMTVADNGQGFDTRLVRGLGLVGMRERVESLGGSFAVVSQLGAGTRVMVSAG